MQEAVYEIGKIVKSESSIIEGIMLNNKKGEPKRVLKMDFSTQKTELTVDVSEEIDADSAERYFHIGSASGPNSPQWFSVSKVVDYHLTETLCNLTEVFDDSSTELGKKLKNIFENYTFDMGADVPKKYRYPIDLQKVGIIKESMSDIKKLASNGDGKVEGKKLRSILSGEFLNYLKEEKGLKKDDIGLCVITIDQKPISEYPEYIDKATAEKTGRKEKSEDEGKKQNNGSGYCYFCSEKKDVSSDLKKLDIKYFVNDKISFASFFTEKGFDKNILVCQECFESLMAGEKQLKERLKTKIGCFDVYVVPQFILSTNISKEEFEKISDKIIYTLKVSQNLDSLDKVQGRLQDYILFEDDTNDFYINFVFFEKSNSATKIMKLIKDVKPSRLAKIFEKKNEIMKIFIEYFPENLVKGFNLNYVYFFSVQKIAGKNSYSDFRLCLETYDAVFTGKLLNRQRVISRIVQIISQQFYSNSEYWEKSTADSVMYYKFLKEMGNIKEEEGMDVSLLELDEKLRTYIKTMNYTEEQVTMFMLGFMVGRVGNQQKQLNETKPILRKINFHAMDKPKIMRLANEVFEKMYQLKIDKYYEKEYGLCKSLLDKNIKNTGLSSVETVFYILSGYAYSTNNWAKKSDKSENKEEEE
ncbi:MAG TPA: TIGR02556 family CRISPR-associated protein [Petrotogaceae bacterium]|nr:TIGR02556 family CRISPR-associated protein [Petrotogaceae bacterium]